MRSQSARKTAPKSLRGKLTPSSAKIRRHALSPVMTSPLSIKCWAVLVRSFRRCSSLISSSAARW
jgi:hypothetical protein